MLQAAAACLLLVSAGCREREATGFGPDDSGSGPSTETGYISFAASDLRVEMRSENVDSSPGGTRAANIDPATYTVEIVDAASGSVVKSFLYGDRGDAPMAVPVGTYYLRVYSNEMTQNAAWGDEPGVPTYGATSDREHDITVAKTHTVDNPAQVGTITCHMQEIMVTVSFDDSMERLLSTDTECYVRLNSDNSRTLYYNKQGVGTDSNGRKYGQYGIVDTGNADENGDIVKETKVQSSEGFLKPSRTNNTLMLYLSTTFNGSTITAQPFQVSTEAKGGEHRRITIYLTGAGNGSIEVVATVETWVYDELVDIDTRSLASFTEERIPDLDNPDAPKFHWGAFDFADTFNLTSSQFDTNGDFTGDALFTVETTTDIVRFTVRAESDNSDFAEYIRTVGLDSDTDLVSSAASIGKTTLRGWGFPDTHFEGTELPFNLSGLMNVLYPDYYGEHRFIMTVTDAAGLHTTVTLRINCVQEIAEDPSIIWVGSDINVRHEVVTGMQVKIEIRASKGIKALDVEISGALTPEELDGLNLAPEFDLINPDITREGLGSALEGLGFPVGDAVRDQSYVGFDISKFMGLLGTFQGDTNFKLTVTDNDGQQCTRTIMLHVN